MYFRWHSLISAHALTYGSANRDFPTICSFAGSATISPAAVGGSNRTHFCRPEPITGDSGCIAGWVAGAALCWAVKFLTGWSSGIVIPARQVAGVKKVERCRRATVECNYITTRFSIVMRIRLAKILQDASSPIKFNFLIDYRARQYQILYI